MSYEKLFTPGRIANLELKNRIVMPAMGCSLAESSGEAGARMIRYYTERAKGGTGLIITEITRIDDETGVGTPNQLSVTKPYMTGQLSRLAEAVHAYDTKLFVQLHHPGNQTPSRLIGGKQPVSASDVTCKVIGEQPRALTTEEVEGLVKKFVFGAVIAQKAAGLIRAGHTIFIDSGSTTTALAAAMEDMNLLVFTNSLTVASELARLEHVMSFMVGGRLNRYSMSTTGARAIEVVRSMTFDQVFLGVTGHRRGEGFSCGSDDEAVFKKTLVDRSNECIVLMDSSKEDRPSTFKIGDLRDVDVVVSDDGLSTDFVSACEDQGVTVL